MMKKLLLRHKQNLIHLRLECLCYRK